MKRSVALSIRRTLLILLALPFLSSPSLFAQKGPEIALPLKRIMVLEGNWKGDVTVTIGEDQINFELSHLFTKIADGLGLQLVEHGVFGDGSEYNGVSLLGYDPGSDLLHLYSVTTDPATHDHSGRWSDAKHITFRYEGLREGKSFVEDIVIEIRGKNEYHFDGTVRIDGEVESVTSATMKRI